MKRIDVSATVEEDGELRIRSGELRAGQRVDARLVIRDAAPCGRTVLDLRGMFRGTWGSAEAVDRYLRGERDAWEQ